MSSMVTSTDYEAIIVQKNLQIQSLTATINSLNSTIAVYQSREAELSSWVSLKAELDAQIVSLQEQIAYKDSLLGISSEEMTSIVEAYHKLQAEQSVKDLETKNLRDYYISVAEKAKLDSENAISNYDLRFQLLSAKFPFDLSLALTRYDSNGSLDGNGCEFKDGNSVSVSGRSSPYIVVRSFQVLVSDSSYTVLYDLIAQNGSVLTAPEAMLVSYVSVVQQTIG